MVKRRNTGSGAPLSEADLIDLFKTTIKKLNGLIDRPFCLELAKYKATTSHWVKTKKLLAKAGGHGWWCDVSFDVLARIGNGTLPLDIWGKVPPTKLWRMTYDDAMDILANTKYDVRDDANPNKVVRLPFKELTRKQEAWLIGTNGKILSPTMQIQACIPKEAEHEAEELEFKPPYLRVIYHNLRGRKKIVRVPLDMLKRCLGGGSDGLKSPKKPKKGPKGSTGAKRGRPRKKKRGRPRKAK